MVSVLLFTFILLCALPVESPLSRTWGEAQLLPIGAWLWIFLSGHGVGAEAAAPVLIEDKLWKEWKTVPGSWPGAPAPARLHSGCLCLLWPSAPPT